MMMMVDMFHSHIDYRLHSMMKMNQVNIQHMKIDLLMVVQFHYYMLYMIMNHLTMYMSQVNIVDTLTAE